MEEIRNSFWGYNKEDVRNLILQKDKIIDAQKKDIDFLRSLANEQPSKGKTNDSRKALNNKNNEENNQPEL